MASRHVMTPARKAALRKAQLASARKRRRSGKVNRAKRYIRTHKKMVAGVAVGAAAGAMAFTSGLAAHHYVKTTLGGGPKRPVTAQVSRPAVHGTRTPALHELKKQGDPMPYMKYYRPRRALTLHDESHDSSKAIMPQRHIRPKMADKPRSVRYARPPGHMKFGAPED